MLDSPQQSQELQAMINAAVTATMEKVMSKMLSHVPPEIFTQTMGLTPHNAEGDMGSEASSKDLHYLTILTRTGLTVPHTWAKGKTSINTRTMPTGVILGGR
ncbi:Hypothetical predicted protein [Pelobates cultripes]|uniref:Uncharacterized protein n=1 Tax=Pelobates cultripes TaxID=61616 RepID=A0AAD1WBB8_PELCU|nr:Hypothetical predicted protein [Pelobates cultripes]